MRTVHELSAGGVVLRQEPVGVALVKVRSAHGEERWVLPKGLVEAREPLSDAALREVAEETGLQAEIAGTLGDVEYWFIQDGVRHHKRVRFFLMTMTGGHVSDHDREVEEAELFAPQEALTMLAYDTEREIVQRALETTDLGMRRP
jgi:8-oxo-dGTP pyrophosphatase MutT (NUDIX family)